MKFIKRNIADNILKLTCLLILLFVIIYHQHKIGRIQKALYGLKISIPNTSLFIFRSDKSYYFIQNADYCHYAKPQTHFHFFDKDIFFFSGPLGYLYNIIDIEDLQFPPPPLYIKHDIFSNSGEARTELQNIMFHFNFPSFTTPVNSVKRNHDKKIIEFSFYGREQFSIENCK